MGPNVPQAYASSTTLALARQPQASLTLLKLCGAVCPHAGENKLRISAGGGIERVLDAMRHHPNDDEVQQKAMGVLFNLAVLRACGDGVHAANTAQFRTAYAPLSCRARVAARFCVGMCSREQDHHPQV